MKGNFSGLAGLVRRLWPVNYLSLGPCSPAGETSNVKPEGLTIEQLGIVECMVLVVITSLSPKV